MAPRAAARRQTAPPPDDDNDDKYADKAPSGACAPPSAAGALAVAVGIALGLLAFARTQPEAARTLSLLPSEPAAPPAPPPWPPGAAAGVCGLGSEMMLRTELGGPVASNTWGAKFKVPTAAACCEACYAHATAGFAAKGAECTAWVFCGGDTPGCAPGECWLKHAELDPPAVVRTGTGVPWTSGIIRGTTRLAEAARVAAAAARESALGVARERGSAVGPRGAGGPRVFFDVTIDGAPAGRIVFALFAAEAPLAAENFRQLAIGKAGRVPSGREGAGLPYSFTNQSFYRIIAGFIDQAGSHTESVFGGHFPDEPGGLALRHDRPGVLSMANSGPHTNGGHFSIVVAPAPHLDGRYVVFGEVLSGMEVALAVNALANPDSDAAPLGDARIVAAGELPPLPRAAAQAEAA